MWYYLAAEQNDVPYAAAHRDALLQQMPPINRTRVQQMAVACRLSGYKTCR